MAETLQEAVDRLAALTDADTIAEYLRKSGYMEDAKRKSAFDCPVARYIKDKILNTDYIVGVTGTFAKLLNFDEYVDRLVVPLPNNIQEFINQYDKGEYDATHR